MPCTYRENDEKGRWVGGPDVRHPQRPGPALGMARHGLRCVRRARRVSASATWCSRTASPRRCSIRSASAPAVTGVVLTVITGAVILGGIKRIAAVANWLVPFMAVGYVVAALVRAGIHHWACASRSLRADLRDRVHGHGGGRRFCRGGDDGRDPLRRGARHLLERSGTRHCRHRTGRRHEFRSGAQRTDRHDGHVLRHDRRVLDDRPRDRRLGRLANRARPAPS